jgi:hypothetical protein
LPSVHMRAFCWSALYMGLRSQLHKLEGLRKLAVTASHRASPISADTKTRWRPSESGVSSRRRLAGITRLMGPSLGGHRTNVHFGSFSRHNGPFASCPLYPQSRTLGGASKSALTRPRLQNRHTTLCPRTSGEPIPRSRRQCDLRVRDHRSPACLPFSIMCNRNPCHIGSSCGTTTTPTWKR